jgi:CheY-like chemotaxis protein
MLSANAMRQHQDMAFAAGADLHIAKPITGHSLVTGMARALAGRPSSDDLCEEAI